MKLVVAIGGNALLRRGEVLSAANQLANVVIAATQLAKVAAVHDLVLTHGNGPQVGLLALQANAYALVDAKVGDYPLDVLGAETEGMIGYLLEQELANRLPATRTVCTLLTRVEVDPNDPAFAHPTKPIGVMYTQAEAERIAADKQWTVAPDGKGFRRVVASPPPLRVLGLDAINWLLAHQAVVIAAGGGGIPVARGVDAANPNALHGVDAVIDKDLCSGLLAQKLNADCFVIATDVAAVYLDWGMPSQRALGKVTPEALTQYSFATGSMAPKVAAAIAFVTATGKRAVIGSLDQIEDMLLGRAGTEVCMDGANVL
jgi:carbamate kinase